MLNIKHRDEFRPILEENHIKIRGEFRIGCENNDARGSIKNQFKFTSKNKTYDFRYRYGVFVSKSVCD
jgi:hypothetical protein